MTLETLEGEKLSICVSVYVVSICIPAFLSPSLTRRRVTVLFATQFSSPVSQFIERRGGKKTQGKIE